MILGTKARYAVMAMVELANRTENDKPVTLACIAEAQEIPLPYLEQIFAKLRRSGLVDSVRGPGGGYTLAQPLDKLQISSIIVAVDESLKMTRCSKDDDEQSGCLTGKSRCATHDLWEGLSNHIYQFLNEITLEDVCERRLNTENACGNPGIFLKEALRLQSN